MFSVGKGFTQFAPEIPVRHLAADLVIQETEICNSGRTVLYDECIGQHLAGKIGGIMIKETVQLCISAVERLLFFQIFKP